MARVGKPEKIIEIVPIRRPAEEPVEEPVREPVPV
jgi:hypothetical protein